jgi:hypothetical protein
LEDSDTEISHDVEKYIFAKVAELASEQNLSEEMVAQVQQTLLAGADGTFLWVGFVANELQGRSWNNIDDVLLHVLNAWVGFISGFFSKSATRKHRSRFFNGSFSLPGLSHWKN